LKVVVQQDQVALGVAQQRYREGAIDFLNVLTVQRDLLNAESDLAQSQASAAVNLVILYKALGGGWEPAFPEAHYSSGGMFRTRIASLAILENTGPDTSPP
jgi:outer membrane protein TolC